jgi:low affinity Fe/Cu permease
LGLDIERERPRLANFLDRNCLVMVDHLFFFSLCYFLICCIVEVVVTCIPILFTFMKQMTLCLNILFTNLCFLVVFVVIHKSRNHYLVILLILVYQL